MHRRAVIRSRMVKNRTGKAAPEPDDLSGA